MGAEGLYDILRQALWVAAAAAGPLLVAALIVGVLIGLLQALTSVQEATLSFVPKIGAMMAVFWVSMSFMTQTLVGFFHDGILPLIVGR